MLHSNLTLVGVGGVLQVIRNTLNIKKPRIPINSIELLRNELANHTIDERISIFKIPNGRADIMPIALTIVLALSKVLQSPEIIHASCNLRSGIAHHLFTPKSNLLL